jgi:uncharacterized secreted protein with C-terminal beta-propeller domain
LEALEERFLLSGDVPPFPIPNSNDPYLSGVLPGPAAPSQSAEQVLDQYLIDQAVARWQSVLGTTIQGNYYAYYPYYPSAPFMGVAANLAVDTPAGSFSTTNVQVAGVDEADLVKTDGSFIYVLSGDVLDIVKAWPATSLDIASYTTIEGQPIGLYLSGSRLTVISNVFESLDPGGAGPAPAPGANPWQPMGIALPVNPVVPIGAGQAQVIALGALGRMAYDSYGQTLSRPMLKLTVFDVTNPSDPQVVQESYLNGSYVDSRAIGDQVYLVAENGAPAMPPPLVQQNGTSYTYETEADYRARLLAMPVDQFLPQLYAKDAKGSLQATGPLTEAANIHTPAGPGANELVTVAVFDVMSGKSGPVDSVAVLSSNPQTVYANQDDLYLISDPLSSGSSWWSPSGISVIQKFTLNGDSVALVASGTAPGQISQWPNGQFSLDEYNGDLRIATSNFANGYETSNIYVLAQQASDLDIVGSLENIAPGEKIFAVQFMQDHGFVVTFHSFDPLFTLDLSDPTDPRVIGQLEVPGVSRYIQAIDANHLVGFGLDVNGGEGSDLELSLFDVSDLSHPVLVDHHAITSGLWAVYSQVFDHHAFGYYPEYQTLAIPTLTALWGNGESSLFVFQINPDTGFEMTGQIQQSGVVERSLRIENMLYSISTKEITAQSITDPNTTVGEVNLPGDGSGWGYNGRGPIGLGVPGGGMWWRPPVIVLPPPIPPVTPPPLPHPAGESMGTKDQGAPPVHADPLSLAFGIPTPSSANPNLPQTFNSSRANSAQTLAGTPRAIDQIQPSVTGLSAESEGYTGMSDAPALDLSSPRLDDKLDGNPEKLDFASPPELDVTSKPTSTPSHIIVNLVHSTEILGESASAQESRQLLSTDHEELSGGLPSDPLLLADVTGSHTVGWAESSRPTFWTADLDLASVGLEDSTHPTNSPSRLGSIWQESSASLLLLLALPSLFYRQSEAPKRPRRVDYLETIS